MAAASNPEDYSQLAKDSIIASSLGASGMVSRILLSKDKLSLPWIIRWMLAASIVSVFVGFALQDYVQSITLRFAAIGLSGASAPEVLDLAIEWVRKKMSAEVSKVKVKTDAKPKRNKRK